MAFTWDPEKNEVNKLVHHIAFEDVVSVFDGPTLERYDGREDYGEDRWVLVGRMQGSRIVVVVVYTERDDVTRLISARKAKTYEREIYESYLRSL
jgi:uncharacterized DUF497 family protein